LKIAIPEFKGQVAPTFDFSRHLLLLDFSADKSSQKTTVDFAKVECSARPGFLKEFGADLLLCGSISREMTHAIEECGIRIIPGLSGKIEDVLETYVMTKLRELNPSFPGVLEEIMRDPPAPEDHCKEDKPDNTIGRWIKQTGKSFMGWIKRPPPG